MRIAIMGTGHLGSRYGAALVLAGEDVTFIARGKRLDGLRSQGLTVSAEQVRATLVPEAKGRVTGETVTLRVKATDDPGEVGPVDLVLFCVKTYDLDQAAQKAKPLVGPSTVVIPVQNGIGIPERLIPYFGSAVVGGLQGPGITFWLCFRRLECQPT